MTNALSIATSGLIAQSVRLSVAASNIANIGTSGALPTAQSPNSTFYKPLSVSYTALTTAAGAGSGVRVDVVENQNGYTPVYDPSNLYANSDGLVAAPNIDLVRELVNTLEARTSYRANVSVIKTQNEMLGALMDTIG